jgi:hypothetical protein
MVTSNKADAKPRDQKDYYYFNSVEQYKYRFAQYEYEYGEKGSTVRESLIIFRCSGTITELFSGEARA